MLDNKLVWLIIGVVIGMYVVPAIKARASAG